MSLISYRVVPVKVIYESAKCGPRGQQEWILDLSMTTFTVKSTYINQRAGIQLRDEEILNGLSKMMYSARLIAPGIISVAVVPSRTDVLHPCDIMEDVAIQYGFTNIERTIPKTATIAEAFPINKLTDAVRLEMAIAGYTESLTLTLCSYNENGPYLKQETANLYAVELSNPMTAEYQVVRTSLLPGLLKMISHNRAAGLPLKLFEASDVVLKDEFAETGARNERRLAVLYCGTTSGFEIMHGTLDRIMKMISVAPSLSGDHKTSDLSYALRESTNSTFFAGRRVDIVLLPAEKIVGTMGVIHPEVLGAFEINNVVSGFELQLEHFL